MNEYMLAVLLEQKNEGESFGRWPLHITLVPWFAIKGNLDEAAGAFKTALQSSQAFSVTTGTKTRLHGREVALVQTSTALQALHMKLLHFVDEYGAVEEPLRFVGKDYTPHITEKVNATVQPGFNISVKKVYLIEAPKGNPSTRIKRVVSIGVLS